MSNTNDLSNRINDAYSKLSKGQKRLATYITDNYDKAVFLTAAKLGEVEGKAPPVLELDVTPWRDDVPRTDAPLPDLDPRIAGATVIIVDDVLYTGRTVRAAIEAISHRGRAERIQLAVLVDRGHRELPLRPDYIGKNLPTARDERVFVRLTEVDGEDSVNIQARNP